MRHSAARWTDRVLNQSPHIVLFGDSESHWSTSAEWMSSVYYDVEWWGSAARPSSEIQIQCTRFLSFPVVYHHNNHTATVLTQDHSNAFQSQVKSICHPLRWSISDAAIRSLPSSAIDARCACETIVEDPVFHCHNFQLNWKKKHTEILRFSLDNHIINLL